MVADFNAGWISRYNHEFGTDLLPEHVDIWDAPTLLTHFTDMGDFWRWARTSGGGASIFRVLEPYHGAVEALLRLARRHRVRGSGPLGYRPGIRHQPRRITP